MAVVMMACGVALIGSVTALFASWLVGQVTTPRSPRPDRVDESSSSEASSG